MFERLANLPVWAIYILIATTLLLSLLILGRIWFPEVVDEDIFWRVLWSYIVLVVSTYVISKMGEVVNKMKSDQSKLGKAGDKEA